MTISLFKYDTVGRPLTKDEVDGNWTAIEDAINDALAGALPVSAITLIDDNEGQFLRFLDGEGTALASVPFPAMLVETGEWEPLVEYTTRHIAIHDGGTYLCRVAHTAGTFSADFYGGKWVQLGSSGATSIAFNPGTSGLNSVTTQDAIVELAEMIGMSGDGLNVDDEPTAADIAVTPSGSVTATNVQDALVQLAAQLESINASIADHSARIAELETA